MGQASRTQELLGRLSGRPHHALELGQGRVLLVIPSQTAAQPQGQLLAHFVANLIARLFPIVQVLDVVISEDREIGVFVPRWRETTLRKSIERMFAELAPPVATRIIENVASPDGYDCIVAVGRPESSPTNLFLGSIGWIAQVSTTKVLPVAGSPNPVGAYATACFGAAQVWNSLLIPYRWQLPTLLLFALEGTLTFSCFDYRHDAAGPNPALPEQVHVGRVTIVGLGAGGGASAYTLASVSSLNGTFTLIEPDEITDTGLNRAVAACASDAVAARPKVNLYSELLGAHLGAMVRTLPVPFDEGVAGLASADLERVVAAVHSREARKAIQMETPRTIWDAGATETGEFWVWRVLFGQSECLACRFREDGRNPERAKALQLSQVLGLTQDDWLTKLRNNSPFTEEDVKSIHSFIGDAITAFALPHLGQRFGDWEIEQCGKMVLPDVDEEIPIPFAPVMAGVLIAGEVIKHEMFPDFTLDSYYWNTLLGQFMHRNRPTRRTPRTDCPVCQSKVFRSQYARRWGEVARSARSRTRS